MGERAFKLPVSPRVGSSAMSATLKHAYAPCCMRVTRSTRDAPRYNPTGIRRLLALLYNFMPRLDTLSLCLFTCQHKKKGVGSETDKRLGRQSGCGRPPQEERLTASLCGISRMQRAYSVIWSLRDSAVALVGAHSSVMSILE